MRKTNKDMNKTVENVADEPKFKQTKKSIAIFHTKVKGGVVYDVKPLIAVDANLIKTINTSLRDGTTLVVTTNGVIAIEESFDEATRIWANT